MPPRPTPRNTEFFAASSTTQQRSSQQYLSCWIIDDIVGIFRRIFVFFGLGTTLSSTAYVLKNNEN
jgi:hypothetical protein